MRRAGGKLCPNISSGDSTLQNALAMDLWYDPEMLHTELALYEMLQYAGCKYAAISVLCMQENQTPAAMWGHYHWAAQPFGYGDGSDGKAINVFWTSTAPPTIWPTSASSAKPINSGRMPSSAHQREHGASAPVKHWFPQLSRLGRVRASA